jgi:hypothetical protein
LLWDWSHEAPSDPDAAPSPASTPNALGHEPGSEEDEPTSED